MFCVKLVSPQKVNEQQCQRKPYLVKYTHPVTCDDGHNRERIFYQCSKLSVGDGFGKAVALEEQAHVSAWRHVQISSVDRLPA